MQSLHLFTESLTPNFLCMRTVAIFFLLISTISCQPTADTKSNDGDFHQLTSLHYKLEELNRLKFLRIIKSKSLKDSSNFISQKIMEIYYIIDSTNYDLLVKSGGVNKNGELLGGKRKDMAKLIFEKNNILFKVKQQFNIIKKYSLNHTNISDQDIVKELESSLYLIIADRLNSEYLNNSTLAVISLSLMLIQYDLLLVELSYIDKI